MTALAGVHQPHVEHRVHLDGDVVAGDDVLVGDVERHDPERDPLRVREHSGNEDEPRPLGPPEAAFDDPVGLGPSPVDDQQSRGEARRA